MLPNSNSALKLGTRFVIGPENNMGGDITMPLFLKTKGSAGYRVNEIRALEGCWSIGKLAPTIHI